MVANFWLLLVGVVTGEGLFCFYYFFFFLLIKGWSFLKLF